jgi:hypothetical protein
MPSQPGVEKAVRLGRRIRRAGLHVLDDGAQQRHQPRIGAGNRQHRRRGDEFDFARSRPESSTQWRSRRKRSPPWATMSSTPSCCMSQSAMCASVPTGAVRRASAPALATSSPAAIRQMPKELDSLRHTLAMSM